MVITRERRLKGTGLAGVGRRVIVKVVMASPGMLTIVAVPSEACRECIIVTLLADIVTLTVELEGTMFRKACEARKDALNITESVNFRVVVPGTKLG